MVSSIVTVQTIYILLFIYDQGSHKCWQPAKKMATWWFEPSTFWGKRVKWDSESMKLPTALNYQAAYFYILAVYFKT